MSFKRLDLEDIVISSDSITAPAWSNNAIKLSSFYTSSAQVGSTSGDYYFNIYQTGSEQANAAIQFSVAFGHVNGSGSVLFNSLVTTASPSSVIYRQYRTLVEGTEESNFTFGNSVEADYIYAISVERARYKEKLLPGSLTLQLSNGANTVILTDDSNATSTVTYTDAGRVYNLVSGSQGTVYTGLTANGYTTVSGSYGKFLPDVGLLIFNGPALDLAAGAGGIALGTGLSGNTHNNNNQKLFNALVAGTTGSLTGFTLRTEETISSNYVFVRARNSEFNYSINPSNVTGSGELRHNVMVDSPQSYITTVGLYNDNNDLLAVAKLSRPLLKDFTKESLIRIKLDY